MGQTNNSKQPKVYLQKYCKIGQTCWKFHTEHTWTHLQCTDNTCLLRFTDLVFTMAVIEKVSTSAKISVKVTNNILQNHLRLIPRLRSQKGVGNGTLKYSLRNHISFTRNRLKVEHLFSNVNTVM